MSRDRSPKTFGSAKYHFIIAIESAIDLCNHLIARNGCRAPEDYGDTFRVMAEAGALPPAFAEGLAAMANFATAWCTSTGRLTTARFTRSCEAAWETSAGFLS